ncbi:MAG: hypothetical protein WBQ18_03405 [Solirubrobacteraceae bacterium]
MEPSQRPTPGQIVLSLTRLWLPLAIAVVGIVMIVLGHGSLSDKSTSDAIDSGAGVALVITAIIVWMINWMYRLSLRSNDDREEEERAREYFDRTGRWPEDEPR